ncbi:head-tail connector protein [Bacillus infantis]|uniref:head-tail connector protein n=1 Tax=Bacillus infantis TaxID=324767 RepID=UPI003CF7EE1C
MLTEVKQYLRIEEEWTEEDSLLSSLIVAAKMFIKNATGITADESDDLHKLVINLLVVHWFENREPIGKANKLAFSLDSILFQLQYSGSVVE